MTLCDTLWVGEVRARRERVVSPSIPQLERLPSGHESLLPQQSDLLLLARRVRHLVHTRAIEASRSERRVNVTSREQRQTTSIAERLTVVQSQNTDHQSTDSGQAPGNYLPPDRLMQMLMYWNASRISCYIQHTFKWQLANAWGFVTWSHVLICDLTFCLTSFNKGLTFVYYLAGLV